MGLNWFKRKRTPERDLADLVDGCKKALGDALESIVVYGSYASGEFHESHSDVNVLLLLSSLAPATLSTLTPAFKSWRQKKHTLPTISSLRELPLLARTHPIEFLDMRDHHKVLAGADPFPSLKVDVSELRTQCEQDLAEIVLKLRRGAAVAGNDQSQIRALLIDSLPSVLVIFRAVLRLRQDATGLSKMDAAERLAPLAGVDPLVLRQLYEFRFARKSDDLPGLLGSYFEVIDKVRQLLSVG